MTRYLLASAATLMAAAAAPQISAAPASIDECRSVADPSARLACYDRVAGQGTIAPAVTNSVPPPPPAAPASEPTFNSNRTDAPARAATQAEPERRGAFDGRIASVTPLPHGYYRLVLQDGTSYFTTAVAAPPPVGAEVRIRHTLIGTTYLDTAGRDPIAIRPSRRR
jgi:hypothetical protein